MIMSKASVYFTLDGTVDPHGGKEIKRELDALPGVLSVSISGGSNGVAVDFDTTGVQSGRVKKRLEQMGYQVLDSKTDEHIM